MGRPGEGTQKTLMEMTEREYFAGVGQRPGMFVGVASFGRVTAFLTGYDQHASRHGGPGLTGWHDWLVTHGGRRCNHGWPGQILHIALPHGWDNMAQLPPEDEKRAIRVLFQLLDEFAAERETAAAGEESKVPDEADGEPNCDPEWWDGHA